MANEIPLLIASQGLEGQVKDTVVETIIRRSSILNVLPFMTINKGFTHKETEEVDGAGGSVAFRALNEDYTDSHGSFRERSYGVKQLGGSMKVEKKVERQIPGTLLKQTRIRLKAMGMFVDDKFFNGSTSTSEKEFDGLKRILGDSGSFVVDNGAALTINTSATTMQDFLDLLDEAFRKVNGQPTAILCSDVLRDAVTSGARKLGADTLGTATDFLQQQVIAYRGVPFVAFGNNNSGSAILPFTESAVAASTGSCYVVRMDEDDGLCGLTTSGIDIIPDEDNLFHRDVIDFDMGLRVTTNSAVRVAGLKVS